MIQISKVSIIWKYSNKFFQGENTTRSRRVVVSNPIWVQIPSVGSNPIWNSDFFRVDVFTLKNFFEKFIWIFPYNTHFGAWLVASFICFKVTAWCSYWVHMRHDIIWLCDRAMRFQSKTHVTPLLAIESPVAQWLEHPTRSRWVVSSNPIWNSDFFRVDVFTLKNFFE